jgi:hypothetical protein
MNYRATTMKSLPMQRGAARWSSGINPRHWFGCEKEGGVEQSIEGLFLLEKDEEREESIEIESKKEHTKEAVYKTLTTGKINDAGIRVQLP